MLSDLMSNDVSNPSDTNPKNYVTSSSNDITNMGGDNNKDVTNIAAILYKTKHLRKPKLLVKGSSKRHSR